MAGSSYTQQLILELMVKSGDLSRGLKQVSGDVDAAGKKMDSFRESAGKALSFVGSVGLGAGVVAGLKKTVTAYGDYVNQLATANQVFGESFNVIEEGMKDSVEAVGLSKTAYLQGTTYIAGLGKAAGLAGDQLATFSQDMVALGADLAAAFNTDVADAIAAIQSGFSGSSIEPLRKYNIVINDTALKQEYFALTGEKVTEVLTQQQRAAAFVSLLYKQSADFQGQWNRESNQFLGTMQRLKATIQDAAVGIGQSFEPAVTGAANAMIPLIEAVSGANSALGGLPVTLALGTAALIAMQGPLTALEVTLARMTATRAADFIGPTLSKSAEGARRLSVGLAGIGTATYAAAGLMTAFAVSTAIATKRNKELAEAIKNLNTGTQVEQIKNLKTVLEDMKRTADSSTDWSDAWKGTIRVTRDVAGEFEKLAQQQPEVAAAMLLTAQESAAAAELFAQYGISIEEMTAAIDQAKRDSKEYAAAQEQINALLGDAQEEVSRNTEAWDSLSDSLGDIASDAEDAAKALDDLINTKLEDFATKGDAALERLKIAEAIEAWGTSMNAPLEEGETLFDRAITNAENYAGMFDQIGAAATAALAEQEALAGHELVGQEKIDFLTTFFQGVGEQFPIIAEDVNALIAQLTGTDIEVLVSAATEGAAARIEELFANANANEVIVDMLVDAGGSEETVRNLVRTMGTDNVVKIVTEALTDAAEEDITILEDDERSTDVMVEAILDEANTDLETLTEEGRWDVYSTLEVNTDEFTTQVNEARRQAAKPIYVRVIPVTGPVYGPFLPGEDPNGLTAGRGTGEQLGVVTLNGEEVAATATYAPAPSGARYVGVQAGQPIINNTTVYQTIPTADPSAIVRSLQKWTRSNGKLPITRGRG